MHLTWRKNAQGVYEGNTKYFNDETGKHEPIYTIEKHIYQVEPFWWLFSKGVKVDKYAWGRLKDAKKRAQEIENSKPRRLTEADEAEFGMWTDNTLSPCCAI